VACNKKVVEVVLVWFSAGFILGSANLKGLIMDMIFSKNGETIRIIHCASAVAAWDVFPESLKSIPFEDISVNREEFIEVMEDDDFWWDGELMLYDEKSVGLLGEGDDVKGDDVKDVDLIVIIK
jgi:hypothetical protein